MRHHSILGNLTAAIVALLLSVTCASAQDPTPFPEKLPPRVIELIKTKRLLVPQETTLSNELGSELLKSALSPYGLINSGKVFIKCERFLPKSMQVSTVPIIDIKLMFDRQLEPPLWAQWTVTDEKKCIVIRGKEKVLLVEEFPGHRPHSSKHNIDFTPSSEYCDLFPIFDFSYASHLYRDRKDARNNYVKRTLEGTVNALEIKNNKYYVIHQETKNHNSKSHYSKYHTIWWLTIEEPILVVKKIGWGYLEQAEDWKVITAFQTKYQEISGVKVPTVYESYLNRKNYNKPGSKLSDNDIKMINSGPSTADGDAEVITLTWKEVNKKYSPELFCDLLLEPEAEAIIFDVKK